MHPSSKIMLSWYGDHKRDLPWRNSRNPYYIWLSEVILQQTRVDQGSSYYLRFVEEFPSVQDLANASEAEVLKLWQGLGYYSRARNLHKAARTVVEEFDGQFPETRDGLLKLQGVGPYTAAAVASIAFNEDVPVVDGNVHRVISRLFDLEEAVNTPRGHKQVEELMSTLLPAGQAASFNQAVMEFGALQCTPTKPDCPNCPLKSHCLALQNNSVSIRPVKAAKTKVKKLWLDYFVLSDGEKLLLRKREQKGIWQNLYDFPCKESEREASLTELLKDLEEKGLHKPEIELVAGPFTHLLSHRKISARFFRVELKALPRSWANTLALSETEAKKLPHPRLIERFWEVYSQID